MLDKWWKITYSILIYCPEASGSWTQMTRGSRFHTWDRPTCIDVHDPLLDLPLTVCWSSTARIFCLQQTFSSNISSCHIHGAYFTTPAFTYPYLYNQCPCDYLFTLMAFNIPFPHGVFQVIVRNVFMSSSSVTTISLTQVASWSTCTTPIHSPTSQGLFSSLQATQQLQAHYFCRK